MVSRRDDILESYRNLFMSTSAMLSFPFPSLLQVPMGFVARATTVQVNFCLFFFLQLVIKAGEAKGENGTESSFKY